MNRDEKLIFENNEMRLRLARMRAKNDALENMIQEILFVENYSGWYLHQTKEVKAILDKYEFHHWDILNSSKEVKIKS